MILYEGEENFFIKFSSPLNPHLSKIFKKGLRFNFKFNYSAFAKQTYRAEGISNCFSNISTIPTGIDIDFFVSVNFRKTKIIFIVFGGTQPLHFSKFNPYNGQTIKTNSSRKFLVLPFLKKVAKKSLTQTNYINKTLTLPRRTRSRKIEVLENN